MVFQSDGPVAGSHWATFAVSDADWYGTALARKMLRAAIQRLASPLFLLDGGADCYTAFEGQTLRLGATVANNGETDEVAKIELNVVKADGSLMWEQKLSSVIPAGESLQLEESWRPEACDGAPLTITVRLLHKDEVVDEARHELHFWYPPSTPRFVTVENSDFYLDGKRWRPHGVNYMPSSGIAVEWPTYFEKWLGADAYHPRIIQRDLERCAALGCNALSIFIYHQSLEGQNLVDLLRRMDTLGMKANLSLRPGTPMDFQWELMKELIEVHRLAENDTVFAYDLAWEPQFRAFERTPFNADWEDWVIERYGSVENTEKD